MEQQFYKDDDALLEISNGVFCKVKVLEVKHSYGRIRYVVTAGYGDLTVENLKKVK